MLIGLRKLSGPVALLFWCLSLQAGELHIAVATNFSKAAQQLATIFERQSGHLTVVSAGSTGKLYAQIMNGAPYDVFLAADNRRPALLEERGKAIKGSRFTYALGRLVVWSRESDYVPETGMPDARSFTRLAIANPQLAPYGAAARETLQNLGIWKQEQPKIVRGESIGQTFQFVASGNVRLGFVARSQLPHGQGSAWLVPKEMHTPIEQQAIILNDTSAARAFAGFLQQTEARQLIRQSGYDLTNSEHARIR